MESLATVDVAQCPVGHQRTRTRQFAIRSDDFIGCADEHGVVDGFCHGRAECRLVFHTVIVKHGAVVSRELGRERVASCLQMHNLRCRRRQPEVLHVDDRLSINHEIMTACHLLSYIEQQCIVASFSDVEGSFEDMTLAHLATTTSG